MQQQSMVQGVSHSALQAAKAQMMQLQAIVQGKDEGLQMLTHQLQLSEDKRKLLQNEKDEVVAHLRRKEEELDHQSKKLENYDQVVSDQNEFCKKEEALRHELASKSEEIKDLLELERQKEYEVGHLKEGYREKDEKLLALENDLEDLKRQKFELEEGSHNLTKENEELNAQCQNISARLSDHDTAAAELDRVSQSHAELSREHESLKSKCALLESVVDELKNENTSSKSHIEDLKRELEGEKEKLVEQEKVWREIESKHSVYSDQLNNKLNNLQNELSNSEEALGQSEEALNVNQQHLKVFKAQLAYTEKEFSDIHSQMEAKDGMIEELEKVKIEYDTSLEVLQLKEQENMEKNKELEDKLIELEKDNEKMNAANEMLTAQFVQIKDDLTSERSVHSVELAERDHRERMFEEQMELMNDELNCAKKRSSDLEDKIMEKDKDVMAETEKRTALEDQLNVLEKERDGLRETIQNLNADIGRLKEELSVEINAPVVEEKIVAFENQQLSSTLNENEKEMEEKTQQVILEEEMLSLKDKLDEQYCSHQNLEEKYHRCQLEFNDKMMKNNSEILCLQQNLESQLSENQKLDSELTELKSALNKTNAELRNIEESHKTARDEIAALKGENEHLQEKFVGATSKIKVTEKEADDLKALIQEKEIVEKELLRNKEEIESQLNNLHLDYQDKETKLRDIEQALEEEKEKLELIQKSSDEQHSDLRGEIDTLKEKCLEGEKAKIALVATLSAEKKELNKHSETQLSEVLKSVEEKESFVKDLEQKITSMTLENSTVSKENAESKEEISRLMASLEQSQQIIQSTQMDREEIKAQMEKETQDKLVALEKLDSINREIAVMKDAKAAVEKQVNDLTSQLEGKQCHVIDLSSKLEEMKVVVSDLEAKCTLSNGLLCKEQLEQTDLKKSLRDLNLQNQRLEVLVGFLTEESLAKEGVLIDQNSSLMSKEESIDNLNQRLSDKDNALSILQEINESLTKEKEKLESDSSFIASENKDLKVKMEMLENESKEREQHLTRLFEQNKQMEEEMKQIRQEVERKDICVNDLNRDCEMQKKELTELKSELEKKDSKIESLDSELVGLQSSLETSEEEKKHLKTNFDACMEDMQQKASDEDAELRHLKCQLAEESRNVSQSQNEMKEMFEAQISQLEDKLLSVDNEKRKLEKQIANSCEEIKAQKDAYENQLSELELGLHAADSESVRLNECIAKITSNFENEITDLRSLHDMQRGELLDSNTALENTVAELQKTVSEQQEKAKMDREDLEQSFEVQMMDLDEKRRYSESEVARLRRYMDEMRKDHETDLQRLEKQYETQLFELEDKCSIMGGELERARKSMISVEGDLGAERRVFEMQVQDLEDVRREHEIKISLLEDDIASVKEQSQRREDEMKSILKVTADKQKSMEEEIGCLTNEIASLKTDKQSSIDSLKEKYESAMEDLETRNKHLQAKILSLEIHVEEDIALRNQDLGADVGNDKEEALKSRIVELKKQVGALSDENMSLKRHLLSHKSSEKKIVMSSAGVGEDAHQSHLSEPDVVPHKLPKLLTSTPSKGFESEDSFSPTVEEVSMIEGFVAEREQPLNSSLNRQQQIDSGDSEPDFVAEEHDRFQPEIVIEKAIESYDQGSRQFSIHPIREEDITEGFQPESGDQFFMETIVEPQNVWSTDLTVGSSPSFQKNQQFDFGSIPIPQQREINTVVSETVQMQAAPLQTIAATPDLSNQNENNSNSCNDRKEYLSNSHHPNVETEALITASEMARKLDHLKDQLEEEYISKMRNQKRDLTVDFECKKETYQREMELHWEQRAQSIKNDWERKFTKALQKVRKDVEKRHLKELRHARQKQTATAMADTKPLQDETAKKKRDDDEDGMPDIAEGNEEMDQKMQQLSRENEVSDK